MSDTPQTQPPGWYYAQGDPPGTQRYWNGQTWEGGPQPVPGAPQAAMAGGTQPLAEPVMRIGARIIDWIIWLVITIIVTLPFAGAALAGGVDEDVGFVSAFIGSLLATLLVAAYEVGFVGTQGATPGKMVLGLKIVREDGSPVDMRDAVMRISPNLALGILGALFAASLVLSNLVSLVSVIIGIVSLVFLFTDAKRQAVWDKIAKTLVVTTK